MTDRKAEAPETSIRGLPPWLVGLTVMVALVAVYRVAELNGLSLVLPDWSPQCWACG
jgi:hypothetical protein